MKLTVRIWRRKIDVGWDSFGLERQSSLDNARESSSALTMSNIRLDLIQDVIQ